MGIWERLNLQMETHRLVALVARRSRPPART